MAEKQSFPWTNSSEKRRASARKYSKIREKLGMAAWPMQQEAYGTWRMSDKAMEAEEERAQEVTEANLAPVKRRYPLSGFSLISLLAPFFQPIDMVNEQVPVTASSSETDIPLERELLSLEGNETHIVAETERRGSNLIVHLLGPREAVAGQWFTLCERIGDDEYERVFERVDESGWAVLNLSHLPYPRREGSQYFPLLDRIPAAKGSTPPQRFPNELRKQARQIEHVDPYASIAMFLKVLKKGDELDRDDAYDQLLRLIEKLSPNAYLTSEITECLIVKTEDDPHLVAKHNKVLEALREIEKK